MINEDIKVKWKEGLCKHLRENRLHMASGNQNDVGEWAGRNKDGPVGQ